MIRIYKLWSGWSWSFGRRPSGHIEIGIGRYIITTEPK